MASFKVIPKPSVEKDLGSLPKSTVLRVLNQMEKLSDDPFPANTLKLEGAKSLFRIL
jgi:mRNA-degrading endonuclease RelE of RelBE toxin-antitoxin system